MKLVKSLFNGIKNMEFYKKYRERKKDAGSLKHDLKYFTKRHENIFGYTPDFKNPKTFNEKIVHRMLFDRNPLYSVLADKLKARIYIAYMLRNLDTNIDTGGGGESSIDSVMLSERSDTKHLNKTNADSINADSIKDKKITESANANKDASPIATLKAQHDDSPLHRIDSIKDASPFQRRSHDETFSPNKKLPNDLLEILYSPIDSINDKLFETNNCKFLPKLYGIYKNVNEIDFDKLPNKFVLKTNHDCGSSILVTDKEAFLSDKVALQNALEKLTQHLNTNYYDISREYHYKAIESRIFAEEMLHEIENDKIKIPNDYGYFAFKNQKDFIIQVDNAHYEPAHKRHFYNDKWEFLPFTYSYPLQQDNVPKPRTLELMNAIASALLGDIDFIRIDLYTLDSKVYVGELTFTPVGGTGKYNPGEYDAILGALWETHEYQK